MNLIQNIQAGVLMLNSVKTFYPETEYRNKRVAIVGAADSAFEGKNGKFINEHDIVVRINRAPHSWTPERAEYVGSKFTHLYHSFFENDYSGGGPIDWEFYDRLGIQKVINPICNTKGVRTQLNYYKRLHSSRKTYLLARRNYKGFEAKMGNFVPTVGFSALMSVLQANFKEVFITGFTFFKTPYAIGYRDHFLEKEANKQHIKNQGLHNPDLEFEVFRQEIKNSFSRKIILDNQLEQILSNSSKPNGQKKRS